MPSETGRPESSVDFSAKPLAPQHSGCNDGYMNESSHICLSEDMSNVSFMSSLDAAGFIRGQGTELAEALE